MRRTLGTILAVVLMSSLAVAALPGPAAASNIPACQAGATFDQSPYIGMFWSEVLNFHYSTRYRTSGGCHDDAVRFSSRGWGAGDNYECGRVAIRTYNDDGTPRRLWPAIRVCGFGTHAKFNNVDKRRLFRFEWHWDGADTENMRPRGNFTY